MQRGKDEQLQHIQKLQQQLNHLKLTLHEMKVSKMAQKSMQSDQCSHVEIYGQQCCQVQKYLSKYKKQHIKHLSIYLKNSQSQKYEQYIKFYYRQAREAYEQIRLQKYSSYTFNQPPLGVLKVNFLLMLLLGAIDIQTPQDLAYKRSSAIMSNYTSFLVRLNRFRYQDIRKQNYERLLYAIQNPAKYMNEQSLVSQSYLASKLYKWLKNTIMQAKYHFKKQQVVKMSRFIANYCPSIQSLQLHINFPSWQDFKIQEVSASLKKLNNLQSLHIDRQYIAKQYTNFQLETDK